MIKEQHIPINCVVTRVIMIEKKQGQRIPIEIDIKKIENGCMVEEYASFCKPQDFTTLSRNLPQYITEDIIKISPSEYEVAAQIQNMVGDTVLTGEYANEIARFAGLKTNTLEMSLDLER